MKRKVLSILLSVCFALALFPTAALAADAPGSVGIGATGTLVTGYYVAASAATANGSNVPDYVRAVDKVDAAPASGGYLQYDAATATLTVHGAVALVISNSGLTATGAVTLNTGTRGSDSLSITNNNSPISINSGATLTLTGSGALTLIGTSASTVGGSGTLTTSGYAGDLSISAASSTAIGSLSSVSLNTTGALTIAGNSNAPTIAPAGDVTLSGGSVKLTGGYMLFSGSNSISIISKNSLDLEGTSNAPLFSSSSGVTLSSDGDVTVKNTGTGYAVNGPLNVAKAQNVVVTTSGSDGPTVLGNVTVAADGDVSITNAGSNIAVLGNLIVGGSANTDGANSVSVTNSAASPTITGNTITVKAVNDITIANNGGGAAYGNITPSLTSRNGSVYVFSNGAGTVKTHDGTTYAYGGDVSATGLDFSSTAPTAATYYKAGSGTLIFTPAVTDENGAVTTPAKLTMTNATLNAPVDLTSLDAVTVDVEGTNSVAFDLSVQTKNFCIGARNITLTGSGSLTAGGMYHYSVTNGNYYRYCPGIAAFVNASGSTADGTAAYTNSMSGRLNAIVQIETVSGGTSSYNDTLYGDVTVDGYTGLLYPLTVSKGAALTVSKGVSFYLDASLTNNGTLVNNGYISLNETASIINHGTITNNNEINLNNSTMNAATVQALKLEGTGVVSIKSADSSSNSEYNVYLNDGTALHSYDEALDFSADADSGGWSSTAAVDSDGYAWDAASKTLTLGDLFVGGCGSALVVPDGTTILLQSGKTAIISGWNGSYSIGLDCVTVNSDHSNGLTIKGSGTLYADANIAYDDNDSDYTDCNSLGIYSDGPIAIQGGSIIVSGGPSDHGNSSGICSGCGSVTISGGTVSANGGASNGSNKGSVAISAATDVSISGGSVTANNTGSGTYVVGILAQTGSFGMTGGTLSAGGETAAVAAKTNVSIDSGLSVTTPAAYKVGTVLSGAYQAILNAAGTPATALAVSARASSGGASATDTTTTKNADGSTTTTVKNDVTGTVTVTTKGTDGSTTVVETKKDGSSTTTEQRSDGTKVETSTTASGKTTAAVTAAASTSVSLPTSLGDKKGIVSAAVTYADGTKETVVADYADGKVSVTVDGSAKVEILDDYVPFSALPFTDLPDKYWATDAITYVYAHGLFSGTTPIDFSPDDTMTRGMLWTVLSRLNGTDTGSTAGGNYYDAARTWAMKSGITDGSNPDSAVTREQVSAILCRYAALKGYDTTATGTIGKFSDAGSVSGYASDALKWAVGSGILQGSDGALLPQAGAQRDQMSAILERFMQNIAK